MSGITLQEQIGWVTSLVGSDSPYASATIASLNKLRYC